MRVVKLGFVVFLIAISAFVMREALVKPAVLPAAAFISVASSTPVSPRQATVIFGGDAFFDRLVRARIQRQGGHFVFSCLGDVLTKPDLAVVNLEGPVTESPSVSIHSEMETPENFIFTFPTSTARLLSEEGIDVVSLANNHILNFGFDGLTQTKKYLDEANVAYFGAPPSEDAYYRLVRGIPLAFISFNEFEEVGSGAIVDTISSIHKARARGFLPIVFAHWGEEYTTPPPRVRAAAHQFVDAGAELIIGSHPHVVQEREVYQGHVIYYSLGNFIFDQYFEDAVRHGLLVSATFTPLGLFSTKDIPLTLELDGRTCPTLAE